MHDAQQKRQDILSSIRTDVTYALDRIYGDYQNFPWEDRQAYGNWLAQTYYYVRQATRLLAFAAARCRLEEEDLHGALLKGAKEEGGHELLALNDLKQLGLSIDSFPELAETAAYHQTLYYAIDHDGPASLIGYFLPLEGVAGSRMAPELARIRQAYGDKAASFLMVHCNLDVGHFDEGLKDLEHFSTEQLLAVKSSVTLSVALYRAVVAGLWRQARPQTTKLGLTG